MFEGGGGREGQCPRGTGLVSHKRSGNPRRARSLRAASGFRVQTASRDRVSCAACVVCVTSQEAPFLEPQTHACRDVLFCRPASKERTRGHPAKPGTDRQSLHPRETRSRGSLIRSRGAWGLHDLTKEERSMLDSLNNDYYRKFGFPFVICVRLNRKEAIQQKLAKRLHSTAAMELHTGIEEVKKIVLLRLRNLVIEKLDSKL
ncbi:hypothetical protein O3P69_014649 [Scylla paramamosain]|uniref:2-oxo-4-hydroxy-4-carboxy-5-ureidoimidazoline decarboxylase n=1 Tax=Scylla paramamosain TaxID=85552 RepID=A0AAW0TXB7_SCYPA